MLELVHSHLSDFQIGLLSFLLLIVLIGLRLPLAAVLLGLGLLGTYILAGNTRMMDSQLKTFAYGTLTNYSLSIIPLFLLMSEFATRAGLSQALFKAAEAWLGHKRGGLAMAAIGASAGFGAICGSSLATASTMGRVALPQLRKAGYSPALATGTLAAGGTLGILIPPSIVLVIYAILAEENIEKLFTAAFIPGLMAVIGYMLTVRLVLYVSPHAAKTLPRLPIRARFAALLPAWPVFLIFILVFGGIYTGVFSPTAAAAVGVVSTMFVAWSRAALNFKAIKEALLATAKTSGMIFFIIIAAGVFNSFLSSAQVPQSLAQFFTQSALNPWLILCAMLLLYLVLGMVMDSLAMIFLTVPIFIPIIIQLDFGLSTQEVGLWFGILVLMSTEIGLITPPVGLNLFVINALAKDTPILETYRGALPFVLSDIIRIALLVIFPGLTLGLLRLF